MKASQKIVLLLITAIYLPTINAIEILPIISSETDSNSTIKRKGIINYLFCNLSSSENPEFVDWLHKLRHIKKKNVHYCYITLLH